MNNWKVWKLEREYRKLFYSSLMNGVGNRFTQVATLALLYQLTSSSIAIGILFVVRMIPFICIAPFSGWIEQKFTKKKLLIWLDISRAPFALIPLFVQSTDYVWLVYASACFISVGEAVYAPSRMAAIPALVKQDRFIYVNAIEQILIGIILVIGSSFGGLFTYLFGMSFAFLFDAVSFVFSAMIISRISFAPFNSIEKGKFVKKESVPVGKMIIASTALIAFICIECTMPLANGIDNVLISIYALEVFGMGDIGVGLMYACLGLGFVISSVFSKHIKKNTGILFVLCIGLEGFGHMLLSISPTFMTALIMVVWITFAGGISNICINTLIMKIVPKNKYGAFFGVLTMISNISMAIAMGAAGWLVETFAPRPLSVLVGICYVLFALLYALLFKHIAWKAEKRFLSKRYG